jgi:phosphate transport system substrate-binding protein
MSRDWKPSEIDTFKEKHGYAPTVVPVAIDMLAVFVHKDNPLKSLSLQEVDAIFSKNRTGGGKKGAQSVFPPSLHASGVQYR